MPRIRFLRRPVMGKRLYVGNLAFSVDSSQLQELFGQHGTVTSAQVLSDRETGRSKGFGFVEMGTTNAINALNGQQFGGRALTVNEARPKESFGGGGGGGRGGYGGGGGGGGGGGRGGDRGDRGDRGKRDRY